MKSQGKNHLCVLNIELLESLVRKWTTPGKKPFQAPVVMHSPAVLWTGKRPLGDGMGSGPGPCLVWGLLGRERYMLRRPLL